MKSAEEYLALVEATLDALLPKEDARPAALSSAMRWAVGTGGKRVRPLICLAAAEAVGGRAEDARHPAAAIELLHNYTLVHDDLPAMDNDTERRGKPSVWAKFGEADAILAGDALQALAFAAAAKAPRNVPGIVAALAGRAFGVVAGQVEDLRRETSGSGAAVLPADAVDYVYEHKTADLFMAAAVMGGLAGGGSDEDVEALRRFALNLGLAFQYEDDLLDGDSPWTRVETERRAAEATNAALGALGALKGDVSFLSEIARNLLGRKR